MLYMRGHSKDYDEWRDMGLEGWGWDDVLPYFKKSENMSSDIENREKFHGTDGPLGVTKDNYKEPIIDFLMEGAKELGYKVGDINGELQDEGFTPSQVESGFLVCLSIKSIKSIKPIKLINMMLINY